MRDERYRRNGKGPKFSPLSLKKLKQPGNPSRIETDDKLIEGASVMFACRQRLAGKPGESQEVSPESMDRLERAWSQYWHRSVALTQPGQVSLATLMNQHHLCRIEREMVVALVMSRLGLFDEDLNTCKDLLAFLQVPRSKLSVRSSLGCPDPGKRSQFPSIRIPPVS